MEKEFEVVIKIPSYTLKTIYVDDATSKTDARKKAKKQILGNTNYYDMSGDDELGQCWKKATIISVEGGK